MTPTLLFALLQLTSFLLIFIEVFLPSFGLLTLTSMVALYLSWQNVGEVQPFIQTIVLAIDIIGFPLIIFYGLKMMKSSKITNLSELSDSDGYKSPMRNNSQSFSVGDTGVSVSELRPFGEVKIKDQFLEVSTQGEWIDKATPITIISIDMGTLYVKATEEVSL